MNMDGSLLRELDEAVLRGTPESRTRALGHTADLLIAGRYTEDETGAFGEVAGGPAEQVEVAARARLRRGGGGGRGVAGEGPAGAARRQG